MALAIINAKLLTGVVIAITKLHRFYSKLNDFDFYVLSQEQEKKLKRKKKPEV